MEGFMEQFETWREKIFQKTYATMDTAHRNYLLYENYFVAENARIARENNDLEKAKKLLQRSLELCAELGLEDGKAWAQEQLASL